MITQEIKYDFTNQYLWLFIPMPIVVFSGEYEQLEKKNTLVLINIKFKEVQFVSTLAIWKIPVWMLCNIPLILYIFLK